MCDVSYYGYFLTKRDYTARDLTELSYKCFDLIKVYGTTTTTTTATITSNLVDSDYGFITTNFNPSQNGSPDGNSLGRGSISATPDSSTENASLMMTNNKGKIIVNPIAVNPIDSNLPPDPRNDAKEIKWLHAKNMRTQTLGYILGM